MSKLDTDTSTKEAQRQINRLTMDVFKLKTEVANLRRVIEGESNKKMLWNGADE